MCTFIPKNHWFPFFVWCISGSRVRLRFFVELGASMIVASTIVPRHSSTPLPCRWWFTASSSFAANPCRSSK